MEMHSIHSSPTNCHPEFDIQHFRHMIHTPPNLVIVYDRIDDSSLFAMCSPRKENPLRSPPPSPTTDPVPNSSKMAPTPYSKFQHQYPDPAHPILDNFVCLPHDYQCYFARVHHYSERKIRKRQWDLGLIQLPPAARDARQRPCPRHLRPRWLFEDAVVNFG